MSRPALALVLVLGGCAWGPRVEVVCYGNGNDQVLGGGGCGRAATHGARVISVPLPSGA